MVRSILLHSSRISVATALGDTPFLSNNTDLVLGRGIGDWIVSFWHAAATLTCVLLAWFFTPFTLIHEQAALGNAGALQGLMTWIFRIEDKREAQGRREWRHESRINDRVSEMGTKAINGVQKLVDDSTVKDLLGFASEGGTRARRPLPKEPDNGNGQEEPEQFGNMQVVS
jgi:hypothetical protein